MSDFDHVVAPIAVDLLACLVAEFGALDAANGVPPRQVCLRPGQRAELLVSTTQDECCSGLVWLRFAGAWPSAQARWPAQDQAAQPCDIRRYAVSWEMGAARCAPTADANNLPTCEEWTDVSVAAFEDGAALRRTLCCFKALPSRIDTLVAQGQQTPMSTEGGCLGTTLMVTISADACDCSGL